MAENIHQQIINGEGTIKIGKIERNFLYPNHLSRILPENLQDEDALVEFFKNFKTKKYPNGILLNLFHQAFGQDRVNWSAEVKRQAQKYAKDNKITLETAFLEIDIDCAVDWIPPVQNLPKETKAKVKEAEAEQAGMELILKLVGAGIPHTELLGKTAIELKSMMSELGIEE